MKITAIGTFTNEQVEDFAINELGYKDTIKSDITFPGQEVVETPNPITKEEAITEDFKNYVKAYFDKYKSRKQKEAVSQIEETLEATKQQAKEQIETLIEQSIEIVVE